MDAPGGNKVKIWQNFLSQILTPPLPKRHVISGKCEQPLDELTVQICLLYDHPNFRYCTLSVSGMELQTDSLTDDPITRCPQRSDLSGRGLFI